ncbi:MAG: hypothetical protein PVH87_01135 [Desulfobacteraceae bacterium]|jgi:hypothetical protein
MALKPENGKNARINLELKKNKIAEIEKLMKIGQIATRKELFENAITLMKWSMKAKQDGKAIGFLGENSTFHEIVMPVLENAKESSERL